MKVAAAVPSKTTNSYISKRVVAFMKGLGVVHGEVLVRSDQEPAMKAILSEVGRVRAAEGGGRYVMEQSLVGCSASNGIVDRAIQSVENQVEALDCPMACRACCGALIASRSDATVALRSRDQRDTLGL